MTNEGYERFLILNILIDNMGPISLISKANIKIITHLN